MIENYVAGDDIQLDLRLDSITSGVTISKAWFTVKKYQADADGSAVFQKTITTTDVAGQGQIVNNGSDGIAQVRFDLTAANTLLLTPRRKYYYDLQVLTGGGKLYTVESDFIKLNAGVTAATS